MVDRSGIRWKWNIDDKYPLRKLHITNTLLPSLPPALDSLKKLKDLKLKNNMMMNYLGDFQFDFPFLSYVSIVSTNITCDCSLLWLKNPPYVRPESDLTVKCKDPDTKKVHEIVSNFKLCVDGGWSEWNGWSDCSSTCGVGQQTRRRLCDTLPPSRGGSSCSGDGVDTQQCSLFQCEPKPTMLTPKEDEVTEEVPANLKIIMEEKPVEGKKDGSTVVLVVLVCVMVICIVITLIIICTWRISMEEGAFQKKPPSTVKTKRFLKKGFKSQPESCAIPLPGGNKGFNQQLTWMLPPRPDENIDAMGELPDHPYECPYGESIHVTPQDILFYWF